MNIQKEDDQNLETSIKQCLQLQANVWDSFSYYEWECMYIIVLHKVVVTFAITLVVTALITVVLTRLCYKNWLELMQKEAKSDGGEQSVLCNYYQQNGY